MKIKDINTFLEFIDSIMKHNKIDKKSLYSFVSYYGVKPSNVKNTFEDFKNYSKEHHLKVIETDYFLTLTNSKESPLRLIKLYIPLKENNFYTNAEMLLNYMEREKIEFYFKIGSNIRLDNVCISVTNIESVKKILNYVGQFLVKNIYKQNPLVFTLSGIGIGLTKNYSYFKELTNSLYDYFNYRKEIKSETPPNFIEYKDFIHEIKKESPLVYAQIINNLTPGFTIEDFMDYLISYQDSLGIMYSALEVTKNKHGQYQMCEALNMILEGHLSYVSREFDARSRVNRYLSITILRRLVNLDYSNNIPDFESKKEFIHEFNNRYKNKDNLLKLFILCIGETKKKYKYKRNKVKKLLNEFIDTRNFNLITQYKDCRYKAEYYLNIDCLQMLKDTLDMNDREEIIEFLLDNYLCKKKIKKDDLDVI